MFRPFCFNHIITDLSFTYVYKKKNNYKAGLTKFRAIKHMLTNMRAVAKILRARASEHPCNFCEQFEQRPNLSSAFKLNGTIRYLL